LSGLAKSLNDNPTRKPIIVFYEKMTKTLAHALITLLLKFVGKEPIFVTSATELISASSMIASSHSGAIVMPASLGRGINIRFAKDADVRVIVNGDDLRWEDVCQMAGRSSRRFGQSIATAYVVSKWASDDSSAETWLKRSRIQADKDDGGKIASRIYQRIGKVNNAAVKKEIAAAFPTSTSWKVSIEELSIKGKFVKTILADDTPKDTNEVYKK